MNRYSIILIDASRTRLIMVMGPFSNKSKTAALARQSAASHADMLRGPVFWALASERIVFFKLEAKLRVFGLAYGNSDDQVAVSSKKLLEYCDDIAASYRTDGARA